MNSLIINHYKTKKIMKKFTFTLALILCVLMLSAQDRTEKVRLGYLTGSFDSPGYINGKLKEMTQITYQAKLVDGKVVRGDKIKVIDYQMNTSHSRHIYNELGKPIHKTVFDDDGNPFFNIVFNYENGNLSKVFFVRNDTLIQINAITNENNLIKQIEFIDPLSNEVKGKTVYNYKNSEFFSSAENYNKTGEKTLETSWERDKFGRILTITHKDKEGKVIDTGKYSYGEHFEPISTDLILWKGEEINRIRKRDHELEHDENGNWIKQVLYHDGEPFRMIFRTYKFYEN
jgi:hypothetical protein